jgi:hypothetical protein
MVITVPVPVPECLKDGGTNRKAYSEALKRFPAPGDSALGLFQCAEFWRANEDRQACRKRLRSLIWTINVRVEGCLVR